ncbi:MAG TPA: Clp protease N-terminal domain-containing protein, partial [Candidatus Obscuribacter sp.]|nr:Clp protease N-terminal domain-containing protein [Candidatus Obscuribacter sp.]
SDEISRIVSGTQFVSSKLSANYIGTEHLLLAILLNDSGAELVKELGVDADALCLVVLRLLSQRGLDPETLRLPE